MKLVIYFIALFLGTGAEFCPPCEMMIHASGLEDVLRLTAAGNVLPHSERSQ